VGPTHFIFYATCHNFHALHPLPTPHWSPLTSTKLAMVVSNVMPASTQLSNKPHGLCGYTIMSDNTMQFWKEGGIYYQYMLYSFYWKWGWQRWDHIQCWFEVAFMWRHMPYTLSNTKYNDHNGDLPVSMPSLLMISKTVCPHIPSNWRFTLLIHSMSLFHWWHNVTNLASGTLILRDISNLKEVALPFDHPV
jgi:hypothetical protein